MSNFFGVTNQITVKRKAMSQLLDATLWQLWQTERTVYTLSANPTHL